MKRTETLVCIILVIVMICMEACSGQTSASNTTASQNNGAVTTQTTAVVVQSSETAGQSSDTPATGTESGRKVLVGISIRSLSAEYESNLYEGAKKYIPLSFPETEFEFVPMEANGDMQQQIEDIRAFAAREGDKILYIDPQGTAACQPIAEICEDNKIYWTSQCTMIEGSAPWDYHYYVSHILMNDEVSAYDTATALFDSFNGEEANVVACLGDLWGNTAIYRTIGLERALAEYPNVTLLDKQPIEWNTEKAMSLTQTWLSQYGAEHLDGIWVCMDAGALAVVEALRKEGLNGKIKVTGIDGVSGAIEAMKSGDMVATECIYPINMGCVGVTIAYLALTGQIDPDEISQNRDQSAFFAPSLLVEQGNLEWYIANYIDTYPDFDASTVFEWGTGCYDEENLYSKS